MKSQWQIFDCGAFFLVCVFFTATCHSYNGKFLTVVRFFVSVFFTATCHSYLTFGSHRSQQILAQCSNTYRDHFTETQKLTQVGLA